MRVHASSTGRMLVAAVAAAALVGPNDDRVEATAPSPEACVDADPDVLRELEGRLLEAIVDADTEVLAWMLADDFELVDPVGDTWTRDAYVAAIESDELDYTVFVAMGEIAVRIDCTSAALRYESRIDIRLPTETRRFDRSWHTDLWEFRTGAWRLVWSQTTLQL